MTYGSGGLDKRVGLSKWELEKCDNCIRMPNITAISSKISQSHVNDTLLYDEQL